MMLYRTEGGKSWRKTIPTLINLSTCKNFSRSERKKSQTCLFLVRGISIFFVIKVESVCAALVLVERNMKSSTGNKFIIEFVHLYIHPCCRMAFFPFYVVFKCWNRVRSSMANRVGFSPCASRLFLYIQFRRLLVMPPHLCIILWNGTWVDSKFPARLSVSILDVPCTHTHPSRRRQICRMGAFSETHVSPIQTWSIQIDSVLTRVEHQAPPLLIQSPFYSFQTLKLDGRTSRRTMHTNQANRERETNGYTYYTSVWLVHVYTIREYQILACRIQLKRSRRNSIDNKKKIPKKLYNEEDTTTRRLHTTCLHFFILHVQ